MDAENNTALAVLAKDVQGLRELLSSMAEAHKEVHAVESKTRDDIKTEMNRRLEGMNEFRAEMAATDAKYISRGEYQAAHNALGEALSTLSRLVYIGLGIVLLAVSVIGWVIAIRKP